MEANLDGDLIEGIHAHLDIRRLDARLVRFDADLNRIVDDALYGHKNTRKRHYINPITEASKEASGGLEARGKSDAKILRLFLTGFFSQVFLASLLFSLQIFSALASTITWS